LYRDTRIRPKICAMTPKTAPCFVHSGRYRDNLLICLFCSSLHSLSNTNALYCRAVRCYSFGNRQPVPFIEFIMTQKFRPFIGIQSSANFILTCPACPLAHLHMVIHGFVFEECTKPAHEHDLQVPRPSASLYSAFYHDLKLQHLTASGQIWTLTNDFLLREK
jgi:hypothetical protein